MAATSVNFLSKYGSLEVQKKV